MNLYNLLSVVFLFLTVVNMFCILQVLLWHLKRDFPVDKIPMIFCCIGIFSIMQCVVYAGIEDQRALMQRCEKYITYVPEFEEN